MDLRSQIKTSELHGSDKMITDGKTFVDRKLSTDTAFSVCLMCVRSQPGALPSRVKALNPDVLSSNLSFVTH